MIQGSPAPAGSQAGLKPTLVEQGYFLACQAKPSEDVVIRGGPTPPAATTVIGHEEVGPNIVRVRLKANGPFAYRPGQFVNVSGPEGLLRSYSLASVDSEDFLELHVRRVEKGRVSGWLYEDVKVGETIHIQGPHGDGFYVTGREEQPMILAGAGTGLSPLYGIVRDALAKDHRGPIHLIQGARLPERLYLVEALRELAATHPSLTVHLCAADGAAEGVSQEPLDAAATRVAKEIKAADLPSPRAFLCGSPAIVNAMRRKLFLSGLASQDILADPFTPAARTN